MLPSLDALAGGHLNVSDACMAEIMHWKLPIDEPESVPEGGRGSCTTYNSAADPVLLFNPDYEQFSPQMESKDVWDDKILLAEDARYSQVCTREMAIDSGAPPSAQDFDDTYVASDDACCVIDLNDKDKSRHIVNNGAIAGSLDGFTDDYGEVAIDFPNVRLYSKHVVQFCGKTRLEITFALAAWVCTR